MTGLLTQTQLITHLKKAGILLTRQNLKEHADRGTIPVHWTKNGRGKDVIRFDLEEAIECIIEAGIGDRFDDDDDASDEVDSDTKGSALAQANTIKSIYQGKSLKLKYEVELGKLVERSVVEDAAFKVARTIRDKMLSIPERVSSEFASTTDLHVIKERLYAEILVALESLSEDGSELVKF